MQLNELMNPEYSDNPFLLYRRLHEQGPLICAGRQVMISGSHALIDALLCDRRVGKNYRESVRLRFGEEAATLPVFQGINRMFLVMDPPEHTRLRGIVAECFSSRHVQRLRESATRIAHSLTDAFVGRGACDLATEFAFPLPVRIICSLLDVPETDAPALGRAASALVRVFDPQITLPELDCAGEAFTVLYDYFSALVVSRRQCSADDMVSLFIRGEQGGGHDETVASIILLFIAGHETTSNMICNTVLALHENPLELELLRHNPAMVPAAVRECLRYDSSVQMVYREVKEDVDVQGLRIPAGTRLFLSLGAANHDPSVFSTPGVLDIRRQEGRALSFGGGIHHCLGYRLAIAELEVALLCLLQRLPELRPDIGAVKRNHRANLRGVLSLPVTW